jgi:hypothetical protein
MTLISLLIHAIMSQEQILFEGMDNGSSYYKGFVDVLDVGDTRWVGKYRRWIFTVDHFKGSHVSGNMVIFVVPPFNQW